MPPGWVWAETPDYPYGVGGSGKTSLARQFATQLVTTSQFPDGVWLVELATLNDANRLPQVIAAVLNIKERPDQPLLTTLQNFLQEKVLLLILDNCEHLIKSCSELVAALLTTAPTADPGYQPGETGVVRRENQSCYPLDLPPPDLVASNAQELTKYSAVTLFVERATAINPAFSLSQPNAEAIVSVCRQLDGIPLALELAAARMKMLSIFQLNERLADRFRLLTREQVSPTYPATKRYAICSIGVTIYSNAPEQILFQRLGIFAGSWTLSAAEQICAFAGLTEADVLDLLTELVEKSLVQIVAGLTNASSQTEVEVRYTFLETLRQYSQEKLNQTVTKTYKYVAEARKSNPGRKATGLFRPHVRQPGYSELLAGKMKNNGWFSLNRTMPISARL